MVRGAPSIRVVDGTTLEYIDPETGSVYRLALKSGGTLGDGIFDMFLAGGDGTFGTADDGELVADILIIERAASYHSLYLLSGEQDANGFNVGERLGGFGFETPADRIPTGALVARLQGFSALFLATWAERPGKAHYEGFEGAFDITVRFADGTFDGKAFQGSGGIDADSVGGENDQLFLSVDTTGVLVGNKLIGSVTASGATLELNGSGTEVTMAFSTENGTLEGQFFGFNREDAAGTWGADYTLSAETGVPSGSMVGFFETTPE